MIAYRVLFAFNVLTLLVLAVFFLDGLQYGSPGAGLAIWLPVLAIPVAALAGAWRLHMKGRARTALLLLVLLALPPAAFVLFFGVLIASHPNWQ